MKEYRYITFKPNTSESQTELFSETEEAFETDFLPNCSFIFDILKIIC